MEIKKESKQHIWFSNFGKHIIKLRWFYLSLVLLVTILAGLGIPKMRYDTSIENWFPKGSDVFANKERFEYFFGNSDVVAIHLKTDNVFSKDNIQMLGELGSELEAKVPFADDVISIADMEFSYTEEEEIITEDLIPEEPVQEDLALGKERVFSKEYLKGKIVSKDCTETWLVFKLLSYDDNYEEIHKLAPENVVGSAVLEVLNQDKYKNYNLRVVGTPVFGYEELLFTGAESEKLLGIAIIALIVFLAIFFRTFKGVIIPIVSALASIIIVYGTMGHLDIKMNAFLFAVPIILSLAVSLGYSIHLFNYYERSLNETNNVKNAVVEAVVKSGWATAFAAFTTVGALLSFMAISLVPIRWLGLTSAALIIVIYFVVFVLTATLLSFGKNRADKKQRKRSERNDRYFLRAGNFIFTNSKAIITLLAVVVLFACFALRNMEVNFNTEGSYGMKVPYIKRTLDVAKTEIGSFDSYNISLDFKEEDKVKDPEVLKNFDKFVAEVGSFKLSKKTNSILTIIKDMNRLINENNPEYYKIPDSKNLIAQLLMFYEMSGGARMNDWINDDFSVLRLEVETKNLNAKKTMIEIEALKSLSQELFPDAELTITGGMPRLAALNFLISIGQIKSLLLALLIISILMMFVFGGVKIGVIGLIPNLLPIIIVGGTMSLLKIPVDFVTVTIAPMILGVAVDDTIHLIHYLKSEFKKTGNYQVASLNSIVDLGKALFLTSFIIIISFVIYLTSPINMMVYLGLFVVVGIFTAFVSNLFITPIIVKALKPFGKENS